MEGWLAAITTWFLDLVKKGFLAFVDLVKDAVVWALDGVLGAVGDLIASIPAPAFLASGLNVGSLVSGLPPFALYVSGQTRIGEAMAIIAAAVAFRLMRKLFTLGQW